MPGVRLLFIIIFKMVSKEHKVKFAVVGCGHIGRRHAEMVGRNEESKLVALVDVKDKTQIGLEHYDLPYFNTEYAEMEPIQCAV